MSRKWTLVAALLVCLTTRSAAFGQEGTVADPSAPQAKAIDKAPAGNGGGLRAAARGGSGAGGGLAGGGGLLVPAGTGGGLGAVAMDGRAAAAAQFEVILRRPVDLQFKDTPLSQVADFCANKFDINIRLDGKGLTDAAVDPSAPVTFATLKPISFESALRLILDEFDLTFVIQDEVLKITSKEKADEVLSTKVYYVGDLLRANFAKRLSFGPLMNLITSTVQPDSWEDNGGPGSIQPFGGEFLVFSQKQDVHVETAELLEKLRHEMKAHAGDLSVRQGEPFPKLYHIGTASGEQTAEAIRKLVAPSAWQGQGGEGEIRVVSRRTPATEKADATDVLFIRQTGDVHDQISELLLTLTPATGMMGGGMGGGMGGMGGGMGGGAKGGSGMFRVPASR